MCDNFSFGLALELKKRRFFLAGDDTGDFDFLMFGSFDGLKIRKVDKLSGFIPKFDDDLCAAGIDSNKILKSHYENCDLESYSFEEEKYISTFILKLINSNNVDISEWCRNESSECLPFFSMIMLNISEEAAKQYINKGSEELLEFINDKIEKNFSKDRNLYYDIFETFGYYDYVILIKSDALNKIKDFSDKLGNIKTGETPEEGNILLSTVYTIFGVENCKSCDVDNIIREGCEGVNSVIIDFHLNGNSAIEADSKKFTFIEYLEDYIKNLYEEIEVTTLFSEGESDASIVIRGADKGIIFKEYFNSGMLNPGNPYYNENVLSMKTKIFFDSTLSNNEKRIESCGYELDENCARIYCDYAKLVNREKRIQRRTTSLRQLVQRYYNIARYNHSFEIRALVKPVFESLFLNMDKANSYLESKILFIEEEKNKKEKNIDDLYELELEKINIWNDYDEAIDCFREEVGSFISDISLSDKYFIENSQLKHPSIGSATKLIFFYNSIVNRIVAEFNHEGDKCKYDFLVKCGGGDEVKVKNLFDFLPHYDLNDEKKHKEICLLIIEIPERLLYNVPVTLCAVLHEVFHIVGDRKRKFRLEKILHGISTYLACNFTMHLKRNYYHTREIANNKNDLFDKCKKEIEKGIYNILCDILLEYLALENYDEVNELRTFSREIYADVHIIISKLLDDSKLFKLILENWQKIISEMHENDEKAQAKRCDETFLENATKSIIRDYFKKELRKKEIYSNEGFIKKYELNRLEISKNIFDDINIFIDTFIENYSDYMAINILGMDIVDYLIYICFLKESSEEELIVLSNDSILRYGAVIDYKYGESIDKCNFKLKTTTRENFLNMIGNLKNEGILSDKVMGNVLLERVDALLNKYYSIYSSEGYYGNSLADSIIEYLVKIECDYNKVIAEDIRKKFIVKEIKKIYENSDVSDNSHKSYKELIKIIMDSWLKLADN